VEKEKIKIKEKLDETLEDKKDKSRISALFIDKQQSKIDALKQLSIENSIDKHKIDNIKLCFLIKKLII